jgi:hypothetical protein
MFRTGYPPGESDGAARGRPTEHQGRRSGGWCREDNKPLLQTHFATGPGLCLLIGFVQNRPYLRPFVRFVLGGAQALQFAVPWRVWKAIRRDQLVNQTC